ncbi:formate transporter FocA [Shewanella colwelliana]|uniref:formate transporter FocA n=1 Tax=Shewanella colwelliana TaxID=23 RepID=UPI00299EC64F|nr:formate transporter FocA [Shewanella colwelliana]MDX1282118.1 formate transporter FocA [Shewanella colwelliana]
MALSGINLPQRHVVQKGGTALRQQSLFTQAEQYGQLKITKSPWQSFGLATFAGAFIALAFVFYITVTTGAGEGPWGLVRLAGGLAFSLGLMLVVICGGELFTSTVLSSVAWAQKLVSTRSLLVCWLRVYLGNLLGALLMLLLIFSARMYELDGGLWGLNALHIAQHKLHHGWGQAFSLGILCNMLVCLGVWMTFASKDALTKAILLMLPVAMFVSSGFEHSIANLFMVPLGIIIANFGSADYFAQLGVAQSQFADLTFYHFIINNLIPVTLGNIVGGGLFVGLGYWMIEQQPKHQTALQLAPIPLAQCLPISNPKHHINLAGDISMPKSIQKLTVSELMDTTPFTLTPDLSVYEGLKCLSNAEQRGAAVVDSRQQLVGYVSQQDLLRSLWSEEYVRGISYKVADLMQTRVMTVSLNDSVAQLIELMVVDREKLFPVSDTGILMGTTFASYEERLRLAHANKPSSFPVVEQGKLVGVITREMIASKVSQVYS